MGLGGQASAGRAETSQREDRKPGALSSALDREGDSQAPGSWCGIRTKASVAPAGSTPLSMRGFLSTRAPWAGEVFLLESSSSLTDSSLTFTLSTLLGVASNTLFTIGRAFSSTAHASRITF